MLCTVRSTWIETTREKMHKVSKPVGVPLNCSKSSCQPGPSSRLHFQLGCFQLSSGASSKLIWRNRDEERIVSHLMVPGRWKDFDRRQTLASMCRVFGFDNNDRVGWRPVVVVVVPVTLPPPAKPQFVYSVLYTVPAYFSSHAALPTSIIIDNTNGIPT